MVVEDDAQLAELLSRVFSEEQFEVKVCASLREAEHAIEQRDFDVIVLDRMLPDGDGLELCASLRARHEDVPILMLTARSEVPERVAGLHAGADDYLGKPFEIEELLARLRALQRRTRASWLISAGPLVIDRRSRVVFVDGERVELTLREYSLLDRLALTRGEAVSRQRLLEDVWNVKTDPGTGVLNVHVSRLRDKLGAFAWLVETVHGEGYRLRTSR